MQFLKIRVSFLKATLSPGLFPKKMGGAPRPTQSPGDEVNCSQSGHLNFIAKRRKPRLNGYPELVPTILVIVLYNDSLKGGHVSIVGIECRFYGDCCYCVDSN